MGSRKFIKFIKFVKFVRACSSFYR